jgi:hypothetical protein
MKRPVTVTLVAVLQAVAAVVAAVTAFDLIADAFELAQVGVSTGIDAALTAQGVVDIDPGMPAQSTFAAGILLLALAVVRVLAVGYLLRGRRWARTVLTVLIAVSLAGGLSFLFQGFVLRTTLLVAVDLVLVALLFDRRTSEFIDARSAAGNGVAPKVVER